MVHESSDGLQREGLQAAAAGQHIWVFVGPRLAACREEVGGEREVGPGWGLVLSRVSASVCELSMMIQCFFFGLFLCLHG